MTKSHKWILWILLVLLAATFSGFIIWYGAGGWKKVAAVIPNNLMSIDKNSKNAPEPQKAIIAPEDYIGMNNPFLGKPDALIKIVEFADFDCGSSKDAEPALRRVIANHLGKIYFQYRDYPLVSIHPRSFELAEAGKCAHLQGKFWPFHDKLFLYNADSNALDIESLAKSSGLDMQKFSECMANHDGRPLVEADAAAAINLELRGTPTFIVNGYKIEGSLSYSFWESIVAAGLGQASNIN